jgi:peptidylprolyl isomerase
MYPKIRVTLPAGVIECELYNDIAPKHAERISTLAGQGFYDGILFHRIVPGFVAQAGDPKTKNGLDQPGVGAGGSKLPDLPLEVSQVQKNTRGALAMARTQNPNSANSQFYIVLQDAPHLNMQYTVFGRVLGDGMAIVDKLKVGDAIVKMELVSE